MAIGSLMSFQPPADVLTYEPFFGLKEKPFGLHADPRFLYNSPSHAATFENLLGGIRRREGLLVLTGEIGTGKTMLCRAVLRSLGRRTFSSFVPDPFASREDLLKTLLIDFGVMSVHDLTTGALKNASRTELSYLLADFVESLTPQDTYVVVVVDEAQNMSLPMIEETRILADAFGSKGHLQIVFVGQPELHEKMKLPEMRQVDQRVCGYHRLSPLTEEAVSGYIQHRLQVAGRTTDSLLFAPDTIEIVHRRSGGVPRLINRICDRALQIAHRLQAPSVDRAVLEAALHDIGATTLTPTWSAILSTMTPELPGSPVMRPMPEVMAETEETFSRELDDWLKRDLRPAMRKPASLHEFDSEPESGAAPRPAATERTASKRKVRSIALWRDTGRELRNETYMQRLTRVWTKRAAVAAVCFIAFKAAVLGASTLSSNLGGLLGDPSALPAVPQPSIVIPSVVPPPGPDPQPPSAVALGDRPVSNRFLIAVGLFADRNRADRLVADLTNAGFRAGQRPYQLRSRPVQQVVVGPFASRADAAATLQLLKELGGFNDAHLLDAAMASSVSETNSRTNE